jgi:hypothetical protein
LHSSEGCEFGIFGYSDERAVLEGALGQFRGCFRERCLAFYLGVWCTICAMPKGLTQKYLLSFSTRRPGSAMGCLLLTHYNVPRWEALLPGFDDLAGWQDVFLWMHCYIRIIFVASTRTNVQMDLICHIVLLAIIRSSIHRCARSDVVYGSQKKLMIWGWS